MPSAAHRAPANNGVGVRALGGVLLVSALATCAGAPAREAVGQPPGSAPNVQPREPTAVREIARAATAGLDPEAIRCLDQTAWQPDLSAESYAAADEALEAVARAGVDVTPAQRETLRKSLKSKMMWRIVRNILIAGRQHNVGAIVLREVHTPTGAPLVVFRTGFTNAPSAPDSCLGTLLRAGGVRHVVNLYAGPMHTGDLESGERQATRAAGGTYFLAREADEAARSWRDVIRESQTPADLRPAMEAVARLIREQILRPGGKAPTGHVLVHCGGGMHRTGMVIGVLDRCLNGATPARIEADYKRHVDWKSPATPGGFEQGNLNFIQAFDCALLKVGPVP